MMKIIDLGNLVKKLKLADIDFYTASNLYKESEYWKNYLSEKFNFTDEDFQTYEIGDTIGLIDGDVKRLCLILSLSHNCTPEWLVTTGGWRTITKEKADKIQLPPGWIIPSTKDIEYIESVYPDFRKYLYDSGCYNLWLSDIVNIMPGMKLPYQEYYTFISLRDKRVYNTLYRSGYDDRFFCTAEKYLECDVKLFRKLSEI